MKTIEGIDQICTQDEISLDDFDNNLINDMEEGEQSEMHSNVTPITKKKEFSSSTSKSR